MGANLGDALSAEGSIVFSNARASYPCPCLIGGLNAAGDGRGQPQKIFGVPGVDGFGAGFEGAMTEDRVVNGAAGEARCSGSFERLKLFLLVESNDREALADVADE